MPVDRRCARPAPATSTQTRTRWSSNTTLVPTPPSFPLVHGRDANRASTGEKIGTCSKIDAMATRRFPFPIPFGWYQVAFPGDLAPGEVTAVEYWDRELVLWRDIERRVPSAGRVLPAPRRAPRVRRHRRRRPAARARSTVGSSTARARARTSRTASARIARRRCARTRSSSATASCSRGTTRSRKSRSGRSRSSRRSAIPRGATSTRRRT